MLWQVLGPRIVCAITLFTLLAGRAIGQQSKAVDLYGDPLPPSAIARLGTVRFRHGGDAFSPSVFFLGDSETLLTVKGSNELRFWDARTGVLQRQIGLDPFNVHQPVVSPDGKLIAIAGTWYPEDKTEIRSEIRVLDAATGQVVQTLKRDRKESADTLAFTPDGKLLATLGRSGTLRIEEISSGTELLTQAFPGDNSASLAISPNGKLIAVDTGANTEKLFLWAWDSGNEPQPLKTVGQTNGGGKVQFSPDGRLLAWINLSADPIHIWETEKGILVKRLALTGAEEYFGASLQFSPDGKRLFAPVHISVNGKRDEGRVDVWRTDDWQRDKPLDFLAARLAISRDARLLASTLQVFDLEQNKPLDTITDAHRGTVLQIIPRPGEIITASDDHTVRFWDAATGRQKLRLQHEYWVRGMALSPNGKHLVSSSLDDTVRLWELPSGNEIYRLPGHGRLGGVRAVAFTADGKHICSFGDDFYLRVFEVRNGKAMHEFRIRPEGVKVPEEDDERDGFDMIGPRAMQFSAGGETLAFAIGRKIHFYEAFSGKLINSLDHDGGMILSLVFSEDGKRMLVNAWGKPMEIKLPDGGTLFTSASNQTATLWNLDRNEVEKTVVVPQSGVGPVAFSPDGSRYAVGMGGGSQVTVFGLDGKAQGILPMTPGRISRLAFTADGRSLITALADTSLLVWAPDALAEPPPTAGD